MRITLNLLICSFMLSLLLTGCFYPGPPIAPEDPDAPEVTATAYKPEIQTPTPGVESWEYSQEAENMVWDFLTAYQEDQRNMVTYLSPALQKQLAGESVDKILQFHGAVMEGFVYQSGTGGQNPPEAMIEVKIQLDGGETIRRFYLAPIEGTWYIHQIEVVRPN